MRNTKATALLGLLAATMAEQDDKSIMRFTNPYEGLNLGTTYTGGKQRSRKKSPLTNKQLKRRAAAKAARKSRRKNR